MCFEVPIVVFERFAVSLLYVSNFSRLGTMSGWRNILVGVMAILTGVMVARNSSSDSSEGGHRRSVVLSGDKVDDPDGCIVRFTNALKIPTIANVKGPNHVSDPRPFIKLHEQLRQDFPSVFQSLEVEVIKEYSLMMTWRGTNPSLNPIVIISHLDVVPAVEKMDNWTHGPFSGSVSDGYVWSRGSLDTKFTVVACLEGIKQLLKKGEKPERSVILAFGHDEEVGGHQGAKSIADTLEERNISPELVLDEGGFVVMEDLTLWGTVLAKGPFAIVATAEKTAQNWKVEVRGAGGHASVPDVGSGRLVSARLAQILGKLESDTMQSKLEAPVTDMLKALAEVVVFKPVRMILKMCDHPLVNPVLGQIMGSMGGKVSALVRSTCGAVEVSAGGGADNVLPQSGFVNLNIRTLPSDSRETVRQYLSMIAQKQGPNAVIEDISSVVYPEITVTPVDGEAFQLVKKVVQESLSHRTQDMGSHDPPKLGVPGAKYSPIPVLPMLMTGMTDSRWYHKIAPGRIVRFSPFSLDFSEGVGRIHGIDERVAINEYLDAVRFMMNFIKESAMKKTN